MNTRYYMVIIKGEIKTSEIMSCGYNRSKRSIGGTLVDLPIFLDN